MNQKKSRSTPVKKTTKVKAATKNKATTNRSLTKRSKGFMSVRTFIKAAIVLLVLIPVVGASYYFYHQSHNKKTEVGLLVDPVLYDSIYKQVSLFEKENPNIKVTMTVAPKDSTERLELLTKVLSSGSSSIDVFWGDVVWPSDFIANGWLLPMTKSVSKDELAQYLPGPVEGCKGNDGQLYCLPIFPDAGILYYRKDVLAQNNLTPPQTWDDLVKDSQIINQANPNMTGLSFQGSEYEGLVCNYLEYAWGNKGGVKSGDKLVVNTPQNVEALKFMSDVVNKYKIAPTAATGFKEDDSLAYFTQGKSAFLRSWPYAWGKFKGTDLEGKVGIIPMVHNAGAESAATLGGANVMINHATTNSEGSIKLAKFLSSKEAQKILAVNDGVAPTNASLYSDPEVLKPNPYFGDLYKVLVHAKPRPVVKDYGELSAIMQKYLHQAVSGQIDSQTALTKMQQEIDVFQSRK